MTPYRPTPAHLLPHKRKPLSWWRRIVLGWKARRWHRAMVKKAERRRLDMIVDVLARSGLDMTNKRDAVVANGWHKMRPPPMPLPLPPPPKVSMK